VVGEVNPGSECFYLGIDHKSKVQLEVKDGVLQVIPIRKRKPLAEILAAAQKNGTWDGTPPELTEEDKE